MNPASHRRGMGRRGSTGPAKLLQPGDSSLRRLLQNCLLLTVSLFLGLGLCEVLAYVLLPPPAGPFAHNPIIKRQADDVDLFELDASLGHRLTGGGFIGVYRKGLVSLAELAADPRRKGRQMVLNLGDSSTSGWNSDVVVENARRQALGQTLKSPFQTYRTYSDFLAVNTDLYVVNAGIPGFTSLQGSKYLRMLLAQFARAGAPIEVVTLYFGNNDSTWNGNIQDKYLLPSERHHTQLRRLIDQAMANWRIVTRVNPSDFGRNLRAMIRECQQVGVDVIVIEPAIPKYWMPGLRSRRLQPVVPEQDSSLQGTRVQAMMKEAWRWYEVGRKAVATDDLLQAGVAFYRAQENDFLVPRIKFSHVEVLRRVAAEDAVPSVSISMKIPVDDREFFLDYCHPIEPANELISDELLQQIRELRLKRLRLASLGAAP